MSEKYEPSQEEIKKAKEALIEMGPDLDQSDLENYQPHYKLSESVHEQIGNFRAKEGISEKVLNHDERLQITKINKVNILRIRNDIPMYALYMDVVTGDGWYRGAANFCYTGREDDAKEFFRQYLKKFNASKEDISLHLGNWWHH